MYAIQLDLFKTAEQCEMDALRLEMNAVKSSSDKVRKKLFAENGSLVRRMTDLEERLMIIERNICRG